MYFYCRGATCKNVKSIPSGTGARRPTGLAADTRRLCDVLQSRPGTQITAGCVLARSLQVKRGRRRSNEVTAGQVNAARLDGVATDMQIWFASQPPSYRPQFLPQCTHTTNKWPCVCCDSDTGPICQPMDDQYFLRKSPAEGDKVFSRKKISMIFVMKTEIMIWG